MFKRKRVINIFSYIIISILCIYVFTSIIALVNGRKNDIIIESFKKRSTYVETKETIINGIKYNISYYKVVASYDYEINDERNLNISDDYNLHGTTGDIYLSNNNSIGLISTKYISKKIYIGHCAMVYNELGTEIVEIVGNESKNENRVRINESSTFIDNKEEYLILRTKNYINKKEIEKVTNSKIGKKYNYLYFIKQKNQYYCIDLVTRILEESSNTKITKRNRLITGTQIINSEELFIIYYKEKSNKADVDFNIYYLERG